MLTNFHHPCLLTINAGSSSVKFAIFIAHSTLKRIFEGKLERIGLENGSFTVKDLLSNTSDIKQIEIADTKAAIDVFLDWLNSHKNLKLIGIGHRVVHGGQKYVNPTKITDDLLKELSSLSPFDPEHMPRELSFMKMLYQKFPKIEHIACFDTAFHHDMPRLSQMFALPRFLEKKGVRRYGFHGLSYEFLLDELIQLEGAKDFGKVIFAHLGNGSSLSAVKNGKAFDTSMSFTPASGIPMSTRSGDLDPGLISFLKQTEGIDIEEFNQMINTRSGLLGISETSSDMQDLLQIEEQDTRAKEAIDFFCYRVKKEIGAMAAALGGLDILVFSGGIGEKAPIIREKISDGLQFLNLEIDCEKNLENKTIISSNLSKTKVYVINTDEEIVIAKKILRFIKKKI